MSKIRFKRYTETGKKVFELETEQSDCDEMNELAHKLGLDKFPNHKKAVPTKSEFLFG